MNKTNLSKTKNRKILLLGYMLFSVEFSDAVIQNATVQFQSGNRYFPSISQPSEISLSLIIKYHNFNNINTRNSLVLVILLILSIKI